MNLDCKVSPLSQIERLRAIENGLNDLEYWSPCDLSPLLARNLVKRVEAPFGGYFLEITDEGAKALAAADRIACTGHII